MGLFDETTVGGRVNIPSIARGGERSGLHVDFKHGSVSYLQRERCQPNEEKVAKNKIIFIGIPIRQLFASPANIARSFHYAQYLRQAHSNQGTSRACTGGQSATTASGRWQRSEMARHVTNFVGTSTIRAEMDEREDVSSSGGRCHFVFCFCFLCFRTPVEFVVVILLCTVCGTMVPTTNDLGTILLRKVNQDFRVATGQTRPSRDTTSIILVLT